MMTPAMAERFWAKVNKTETCWLWTAALNTTGYGSFYGPGKTTVAAHRLAFTEAGNDLLPGSELDHICHNRHCVNPAHLRPVTRKQNVENFSGPRRNNSSGFPGVSWSKRHSKWRVQVRHDGRYHQGGLFEDVNEAGRVARELRNSLHTHNDLDRSAA